MPNGRLDLGLGVVGKEMDFGIIQPKSDRTENCPGLAGEGNRTLVSSLEGYSFTIKLHPH